MFIQYIYILSTYYVPGHSYRHQHMAVNKADKAPTLLELLSLQQCRVDLVSPILQLRKLRPREVR